jgi:hypothetical protein
VLLLKAALLKPKKVLAALSSWSQRLLLQATLILLRNNRKEDYKHPWAMQ